MAPGTIQQQSTLEQQILQQQQHHQLLLAKASKVRVVQTKTEALPLGGLPKTKTPPAAPEVVALNLGVVGVGAPGISPSNGTGSLLSRREAPPETAGVMRDL